MIRPTTLRFLMALGALSAGCGHSRGFSVDAEEQPISRAEAEQLVLGWVNRDRAAAGLAPVHWDEPAARAGRMHAEDMAKHGFTAHLGSDGSVPELRYTIAGGTGMVMENVGCFADATNRALDPEPQFLPSALESVHRSFMDEVPPFDGHRKNILHPLHTSIGIGLAKAAELDVPCMAQELVDDYGSYAPLPQSSAVGAEIEVSGTLRPPAEIAGVGIARTSPPTPMAAAALNQTGDYAIPKPYETYFTDGFQTPIPVVVDGSNFTVRLPLSDEGRPGLYEVSVWARFPSVAELTMVSLRTISVTH